MDANPKRLRLSSVKVHSLYAIYDYYSPMSVTGAQVAGSYGLTVPVARSRLLIPLGFIFRLVLLATLHAPVHLKT